MGTVIRAEFLIRAEGRTLWGSLRVCLSLFNTLGCSWSPTRNGSNTYREKGPGVEGTLGLPSKQPLPPPWELRAEGTQVSGVSMPPKSQTGTAVPLAASSLQGMTDIRQIQRIKRGPFCGKGMAPSSLSWTCYLPGQDELDQNQYSQLQSRTLLSHWGNIWWGMTILQG